MKKQIIVDKHLIDGIAKILNADLFVEVQCPQYSAENIATTMLKIVYHHEGEPEHVMVARKAHSGSVFYWVGMDDKLGHLAFSGGQSIDDLIAKIKSLET